VFVADATSEGGKRGKGKMSHDGREEVTEA
jgi:hypothetical protein